MPKPVARLSDPGSHGGAIASASSSISANGLRIARVGDIYACPKHGKNPIVSGVHSVFGQGKHVAHVGSKTACGATITAGSPDTFVGDDSVDSHEVPATTGNRYFIIVDENDQPIADAEYVITGPGGREYPGVTDENGHTSTVYGTIGDEISVKVLSIPDEFDNYLKIID